MHPLLILLGFLALSYLPALTGIVAGPDTWYAALKKPTWNPPGSLFGPVWTVLYASMGVAAWMVWSASAGDARLLAMGVFLLQLALNAAWTPVFFRAHNLTAALLVILLLWAAIAATIVLFWQIRPAAGALLLPYLAWVTFATVLTGTIRRLNG